MGGTLSATPDYGITLNGGVRVSESGNVSLGYNGSLYVDNATSGISGGQLTAQYEYVGSSGSGTFTQSFGTHSVSSSLYLGYNSGSTGTYTLSGGQLSATSSSYAYGEYVGYSGNGFFNQTGGTNNISYGLYLGNRKGSFGSYVFGGGKLTANCEYVGYSGTGTFNQSGGTHTISRTLCLGHNSDSTGSYNLSGGEFTASYEYVGDSGTGTFIQSGGTNSTSNLCLGYESGSTGSYSLSGGEMSAYNVYVGLSGKGTFTQSGGTHTINGTPSLDNALYLGYQSGYTGNYTLNGGLLKVNAYEYVGLSGKGTFTQTGGTHTITGTLSLGHFSGSTGTYSLEGGKLILKSLSKGSGAAQFNFGGGTLQASGTMSTSVPMTLTGIGGKAKIDTAGYDVAFSGALSGSGGLTKLGWGTLTLAAKNSYSGDTVVQEGILKITGGIGDEGTTLLDIQAGKALFQTTNIVKSDFTVKTAAGTTFEIVSGTHQIGNLTGAGKVTVDSGSRLTIIDAVNMTGGKITVQNGAGITFGTPYSADHLYTVSGSHVQMIDDDLGGAGGLEKRGAGTLILDGNNTYLGKTTVSACILQITGGCTLEGKITVADGAGIVFASPYSVSTAPESTVGGAALSLDPPYTLQNTAGQASSGTEKLSAISMTGSSGGTGQSLSHPTVATSEIVAVPEPGTWVLLVVSLFSGAAAVWKKR